MERLIRVLNRWIGWIALALIVIPAIVYCFQFGTTLSDSKGDFGTFGDFMNPFLSLTSILLLGYISLQTFFTTRRFNDVQLRPHLFLQEVPSTFPHHPLVWQLDLVSEAPAVNVFVRFDFGNQNFTKWVLCPPFSKNIPAHVLTWIRNAIAIEVMYSDITSQHLYGVRIEGRLHHIFQVDRQLFNLEMNRNRLNTDFHISLDLLYRSIFIHNPAAITYQNFIQLNLQ